jgi:antitoxin (DNA-binding transcriptional repressor) of toxin-antitoxin stability system
MSAIALPDFERDVRAALARVLRGESLELIDGGQRIAHITPPQKPVTTKASSLVDFFLNSPLRDSGLVLERDRSGERPTVEF